MIYFRNQVEFYWKDQNPELENSTFRFSEAKTNLKQVRQSQKRLAMEAATEAAVTARAPLGKSQGLQSSNSIYCQHSMPGSCNARDPPISIKPQGVWTLEDAKQNLEELNYSMTWKLKQVRRFGELYFRDLYFGERYFLLQKEADIVYEEAAHSTLRFEEFVLGVLSIFLLYKETVQCTMSNVHYGSTPHWTPRIRIGES